MVAFKEGVPRGIISGIASRYRVQKSTSWIGHLLHGVSGSVPLAYIIASTCWQAIRFTREEIYAGASRTRPPRPSGHRPFASHVRRSVPPPPAHASRASAPGLFALHVRRSVSARSTSLESRGTFKRLAGLAQDRIFQRSGAHTIGLAMHLAYRERIRSRSPI